tara:strand:- start:196 stop:408 length:213 start_codon:yes stop_codon:yes gene_type:complete
MSEITGSTYNYLRLNPRRKQMPNSETGPPSMWRDTMHMYEQMEDMEHKGDCNGWSAMHPTGPVHRGFKRL